MTVPAIHVHVHLDGAWAEITNRLQRMETLMTTAVEQLTALTAKVDGIGAVLTDVQADFAALVAAMEAERENLTPAGQAALDAANTAVETTAAKAGALDASVGDADGSDTPPVEPANV